MLDLDPDKDYALVAGSSGIHIYDLSDGSEVERLSHPFGTYYGGIVLRAPDSIDPTLRPEWLIFYSDRNRINLSRYNGDSQEWGMTRLIPGNSSTISDLVIGPTDANGHDTDFVSVDYGTDTIDYWAWNAETSFWGNSSTAIRTRGIWDTRDDRSRTAISIAGGFGSTAALVLVSPGLGENGELWTFNPHQTHDENDDRFIGTVGLAPQPIRCMLGICVVANFGENTITTVRWISANNVPVIVDTQQVGAAPLGIDLIPNPSGNGILALTAGWESGDYTVTEINENAQVTSSNTISLSDCINPGFAHFTDGDGSHVMVTCSGSDKVVIVPR